MNKENLFVYEEDGFCELRYTYGDLTKFERKSKNYDKLQSNWNSLREWLEEQKEAAKSCKEWNNKKGYFDIDYDRDIKMFEFIIDKMNELKGVSNDS